MLKASMRETTIPPDEWGGISIDRDICRNFVHERTTAFEKTRVVHEKVISDVKKWIAVAFHDRKILHMTLRYSVWARRCLSKTGLKSH